MCILEYDIDQYNIAIARVHVYLTIILQYRYGILNRMLPLVPGTVLQYTNSGGSIDYCNSMLPGYIAIYQGEIWKYRF